MNKEITIKLARCNRMLNDDVSGHEAKTTALNEIYKHHGDNNRHVGPYLHWAVQYILAHATASDLLKAHDICKALFKKNQKTGFWISVVHALVSQQEIEIPERCWADWIEFALFSAPVVLKIISNKKACSCECPKIYIRAAILSGVTLDLTPDVLKAMDESFEMALILSLATGPYFSKKNIHGKTLEKWVNELITTNQLEPLIVHCANDIYTCLLAQHRMTVILMMPNSDKWPLLSVIQRFFPFEVAQLFPMLWSEFLESFDQAMVPLMHQITGKTSFFNHIKNVKRIPNLNEEEIIKLLSQQSTNTVWIQHLAFDLYKETGKVPDIIRASSTDHPVFMMLLRTSSASQVE